MNRAGSFLPGNRTTTVSTPPVDPITVGRPPELRQSSGLNIVPLTCGMEIGRRLGPPKGEWIS